MILIVHEERRSYHEHEKGHDLAKRAEHDGLPSCLGASAAEDALGTKLIDAEHRHVLEWDGEQGHPHGELELGSNSKGPIEGGGAVEISRRGPELSEATGQREDHVEQCDDPADGEEEELHDIRPNDRAHATHEGPADREDADDDDAPTDVQASDDFQRQRCHEHPDALGKNASDEEEDGGQRFRALAKAVPHVVVGAVDFPLVVDLHEPVTDDDSGDDGTDGPLKISEVPFHGEQPGGDADEGHAAELRGDDGSGNGRPGKCLAPKKEVADGRLLPSHPMSEYGTEDEIAEENAPIYGGEKLRNGFVCHVWRG